VGNNARFMPQFQGHFNAPYEEPWLGIRQGRQQEQQGQQAQLESILGDFGDPIEERRNVGNNARFMPPFQGYFDAPYEEPWLGRRQGRRQGQQGQQAQFEPHATPPRHGMHFGDPREDQWGLNDQDEAWFDPREEKPVRERPRQYQGAHHSDPYWQEQDGPPWNQGRVRDPRPMKLDFPRGVETRNVIPMRAPNHEVHFNPNQPQFSMPYDDPFEPRPKKLNGGVVLNPIVESLCGLGNARPPPYFEGQGGLYGEEYWREKRFPRQQ
jgi:hypothetical protein